MIVFECLNHLGDLETASAIIFELRVKRLVYFYTIIRLVYFSTGIWIKIHESETSVFLSVYSCITRSEELTSYVKH